MSKIEWTGKTWNPIAGCSILSPGCTNCYAMKMAARLAAMAVPGLTASTGLSHYRGLTKPSKAGPVWTGKVMQAPLKTLREPLDRKKPTTYFVNSMSDLFHEDMPDEWIDRIFAVMAMSPQHTFQVLTKRSARMRSYMTDRRPPETIPGPVMDIISRAREMRPEFLYCMTDWPLPNVWLGVSTERQQEADERIPDLLATPAAVRFISAEPLLGPLDLSKWIGLNEDHDGGRVRIQGGGVRGVDDRHTGPGLAGSRPEVVPVDKCNAHNPLPAATGGEDERGIHAGPGRDRRPPRGGVGSPARLEAFQRTDTGRADDQSQGRNQNEQRSVEFGARHDLGASDPRDQYARPPSGAKLSWVIVGGESGPGARPMNLEWAYDIVDQCEAAGVAVFVKQLGTRPINYLGHDFPIKDRKGGNILEWPNRLRVRRMPRP